MTTPTSSSDLYGVLGVARDATPEDIKLAYRRLAMKHHPDRDGGDAGTFALIERTYAILSDPERRAQYDQFGDAVLGPSIDDEALATLAELFKQALDAAEGQFLAEVSERLRRGQRATAQAIEAGEKQLTKLKRRQAAITVKEGATNLVAPLVDMAIQGLETDLPKMRRTREVLDLVAKLLEAYSSSESVWDAFGELNATRQPLRTSTVFFSSSST